MAAAFYLNPARALLLAGVTGTNGKTTIGFLIHHLLNSAHMRAGLLGTVLYDLGGEQIPATHTTPESLEIQQLLSTMRDNGCRVVYFAGYRRAEDVFKQEDIEAATDQVIWATDVAPGPGATFGARRPQDTCCP